MFATPPITDVIERGEHHVRHGGEDRNTMMVSWRRRGIMIAPWQARASFVVTAISTFGASRWMCDVTCAPFY